MAAKKYDAAIVGAGLNGLVAAAYLARAGRTVLVLERRDTLGGAFSTEEFAPGFKASAAWTSAELFHPGITADLGLEGHGLRLLEGGGTFVCGAGLALPGNDPASALETPDAAAFRDFEGFVRRLAGALEGALTKPLPELEPQGVGDVIELLTLGWRLRKLGKEEMPEALRYLPMPIKDVLDDRFRSEALKAALAAPGLKSTWLAPRSAGSALTFLLRRPTWVSGLLPPPLFALGGMGGLAQALAQAARAAGAEVRTGASVTRILVDDDGTARGVALDGGEELAARVVVSNADPKRTLLELADPTWLEPQDAHAVKNVRGRGTVALVRLAAGEAPQIAGADLRGRIQVGATLDELEQAFDPVKYGEVPERPWLELTVPTAVDPSLAPEGKQVVEVWVQYVPYELSEGSWDERRDELGDRVLARIEEHAPGFTARVEHREVLVPADLEARWGMTGGCLEHAEPALDQLLYLRPIPGFSDYRTPIDGLYLCGPGTHPGVAASGLSGKNAATVVLEDLGE